MSNPSIKLIMFQNFELIILLMIKTQFKESFLKKYIKTHLKMHHCKSLSSNILLDLESNNHHRISKKIQKIIHLKPNEHHYPEAQTQVKLLKEAFSKVKELMNENTVMKYLNRKMIDERFHYRQEILGILTDTKHNEHASLQKDKDFKINQLMYELSKTLNMIEEFISSKTSRQIQILESKIHYNQKFVQESVDLERYKRLTCSFRPSIITNSINIIEEYRSIDAKRKFNQVQTAIYKKLSQTERSVSNLHNTVCKEKEQMKFFIRKYPR